ncbi:hypothetical protein ACFW04_012294 [Cataglyphis niger]
MEKRTWTIVKFSTVNTVEAVSSSWIEHNKCYCPPFKYEQIIAAIRKNVERNTCWPSECTFDLNSEVETSTKRKKTKSPIYE